MTTTETVSPPTSDLAFLDRTGVVVDVPAEWEPAHVVLPVEAQDVSGVAVMVNGRPVEVIVKSVAGSLRVVALWQRAGPGWFDIEVTLPSHNLRRRIRVEPGKIDHAAFAHLLQDLEIRLPVALAIALRDGGARLGVHLTDPAEQTLATEVARLRRAVEGGGRPGLVSVLEELAEDPHRMLVNVGQWVRRERARRPHGADLARSLWRAGNVEDGKIQQVLDRRVEHTVDLYENRLVKAFTTEVDRRLRRLGGVLSESGNTDLHDEISGLLVKLTRAQRAAFFLSEVGQLRSAPDRVTMVLLKRREYRAAYEGFLEFRRRMSVHLDEPALAEPLRNLPYLYQVWGALLVVEAVLAAGVASGFRVVSQRIVWPNRGGMYLKVLKDNQPAVELRNSVGDRLRLYSERQYGGQTSPFRSISFAQRPDVALELQRFDGTHEVYLFDPKYKLDSEFGADAADGKPKKVDIDKMHAYRDAIRDTEGLHLVRHAATLYPGTSVTYGSDVAALRMYPGEESELHRWLVRDLSDWIMGGGL